MAKIRYNKTIFTNGMLGKSTYGRTDSDYYKASVKKVIDGIIYPQGGVKNVTLDETIGVQTNQYERMFQVKKGKFFKDVNILDIYLIGQRKYSDIIELVKVTLDEEGNISTVTVVDTLDFGADLKEYLVQIDNKVIVNINGTMMTRNETYFSEEFQKYCDTIVNPQEIYDSNTFDIHVLTDKDVSDFTIVKAIGAESVVMNNITINGVGDYLINVTANVCTPIGEKRRQLSTEINYIPTDTIPNQVNFTQELDNEIWVGTLDKTDEFFGFGDPVLIDEEADEPQSEDTTLYKIYSQAYQRKGLLPNGELGLLTKYRVFQVDKVIIVTYEGVVNTAKARVAVQISGVIQNPVASFDYPIGVLKLHVVTNELRFDGATTQLSESMSFSPVNPNFKFIDKLLDDLGYGGTRFYGWDYDPINDYFEIFVTSDAGFTTEIQISGTPITQRPEMEEVRLFNGSGRKVTGNNKKYQIVGIPQINTFNPYLTTPASEKETILPTSLFCHSLLDVDNCKLAGKFDNRLVLTQFDEGNSIIAFSRLRSPFDFTFSGLTISDAYISEFKDDLDLKIERIIEHKSLVLFTNKGIYASSLLDNTFNPTSFAFKRVHTMLPQTSFPPEFLNGDLIFLDATGSKLYAMVELKESSRYSIIDLTLYANDIFTAGVTVTTINLAQQVGSEFVLVSSFSNDGLVNFNSDADILSWTTLATDGIYTKVFQEGDEIYVYDLFSHKLTITKPIPSKMRIELLEPEIEFQNGDKLSFHEYYKIERAFIKMYGLFDSLSINGTDPINFESLPFRDDNNYLIKLEMNYADETNSIVIEAESTSDLILQSVSLIIDVGQ